MTRPGIPGTTPRDLEPDRHVARRLPCALSRLGRAGAAWNRKASVCQMTLRSSFLGTRTVSPSSCRRDTEAFDLLVEQHHERLARLAYLLCHNIHDAEDAVADAYARVWPKVRRGKVDNILRTCARPSSTASTGDIDKGQRNNARPSGAGSIGVTASRSNGKPKTLRWFGLHCSRSHRSTEAWWSCASSTISAKTTQPPSSTSRWGPSSPVVLERSFSFVNSWGPPSGQWMTTRSPLHALVKRGDHD